MPNNIEDPNLSDPDPCQNKTTSGSLTNLPKQLGDALQ